MADVKAVVAILIAFVPLPIFWSLFDQKWVIHLCIGWFDSGSRWVEQATQMNSKVGKWEITPDQIPTLNALFTIILTPVFDRGLYPLFRDRLHVCLFHYSLNIGDWYASSSENENRNGFDCFFIFHCCNTSTLGWKNKNKHIVAGEAK